MGRFFFFFTHQLKNSFTTTEQLKEFTQAFVWCQPKPPYQAVRVQSPLNVAGSPVSHQEAAAQSVVWLHRMWGKLALSWRNYWQMRRRQLCMLIVLKKTPKQSIASFLLCDFYIMSLCCWSYYCSFSPLHSPLSGHEKGEVLHQGGKKRRNTSPDQVFPEVQTLFWHGAMMVTLSSHHYGDRAISN